ncbi:unnamed protein product [Symbiodinium sp. KB8]|nr:unnamed protein product [Symbiodinium sp. KB8]
MQVRVDAGDLAPELLLSVRVGNLRRQATLAALQQRALRFPEELCVGKTLKLELLQQVGSEVVVCSHEESYRVAFEAGQLALTVSPESGDQDDAASDERFEMDGLPMRRQDAAAGAKEYLEKHELLPYLQGLLETVCKEKPANPYRFLWRQLGLALDTSPPKKPAQNPTGPTGKAQSAREPEKGLPELSTRPGTPAELEGSRATTPLPPPLRPTSEEAGTGCVVSADVLPEPLKSEIQEARSQFARSRSIQQGTLQEVLQGRSDPMEKGTEALRVLLREALGRSAVEGSLPALLGEETGLESSGSGLGLLPVPPPGCEPVRGQIAPSSGEGQANLKIGQDAKGRIDVKDVGSAVLVRSHVALAVPIAGFGSSILLQSLAYSALGRGGKEDMPEAASQGQGGTSPEARAKRLMELRRSFSAMGSALAGFALSRVSKISRAADEVRRNTDQAVQLLSPKWDAFVSQRSESDSKEEKGNIGKVRHYRARAEVQQFAIIGIHNWDSQLGARIRKHPASGASLVEAMGGTSSQPIDVRVTDRKSLTKELCLRRKDYESMQHRYCVEDLTNSQENSRSRMAHLLHRAAIRDPEICKGGENSQIFMEAGMLPLVISFLFGGALIRCFEVCPLWFVVYYKTLDQVFSKIDKGFKQYYGQSLHLEYARTDWSPVHVAEAGIRIDRILIARVTSHHVNHCTKVSYGYAYKSGQFAEEDNDVAKAEDRKDPFECSFKFDTYTRGRSRNFWIHKDICRFHGDETRVAATQNITPVCVNDRIEIAVNLFNAMGLVDVDKVGWRPLEIFPMQDRECPIEQELFDWYDLDSFQSQSVERLQIPDFFSPQLMHMSTEYAGIDVAVSRTRLRAEAQGVVPQADRILGSRFEVLPRSSPIILPLKRVGLQHDRFTKIQLRQGDCILLYISQGGKMT